jgi:hypothetical protein
MSECLEGYKSLPFDTVAAGFATDISLVQSGDSGGHNATGRVTDAFGANRLEK